ncbi:hypothetical protein HHK36_027535 [Tetracentron sinense]|uniref:Wall-associated receptor kinase galacturonan-binding domain-containing protein n=1 Tax=Tetracentron sinense TaxID=13715 RepID=A0A835D1N5_TETSI|nr:hypothetical protein HHK36_027535 [Tetracentron sinense]
MVRRRRRLLPVGFIAFILALFLAACSSAKEDGLCHTSCGNIHNISYPFYLKGDPLNCGNRSFNYELACEVNRTILYINSRRYYAKGITYDKYIIPDGTVYPYYLAKQTNYTILMDCENPVNSHQYLNTSPCINASTTSSSSLQKHSYALVGKMVSDVHESCSIGVMVPSRLEQVGDYSFSVIHNELAWGFELSWIRNIDCPDAKFGWNHYYLDDDNGIRCGTYNYDLCLNLPSFACASKKFMWDSMLHRAFDL